MTEQRTLGQSIRQRRKQLGLSQEALATQANVSPRFLGSLERGKSSVRLDTLQRVASALGLTLRLDLDHGRDHDRDRDRDRGRGRGRGRSAERHDDPFPLPLSTTAS